MTEERKEYFRAYRKEHIDRINENQRRYRERNRERIQRKRHERYLISRGLPVLTPEQEQMARVLDTQFAWMKEARLAKGMKQWHVARKVGCSDMLYLYLENGRVMLSRSSYRDAVCRVLKGVSYCELLESARKVDS